jgi:plastocyanin
MLRTRSFWFGVLTVLLAGAIVGALVIWSGVMDVGTNATPAIVDKVLNYASMRSIRHHAPKEANPLAKDEKALRVGQDHYSALCGACHGGPGIEPEEFAGGLHPGAPDLASSDIQAFTDGMLYQTIASGIGSTGMPAFGATQTPEEIWGIVAYVRALPKIAVEEKAHGGAKNAPDPKPEEPQAPAAKTESAKPGQPVKISITNSKFDPPSVEVHVGDQVEWSNTDFIAHTATANDKSFDTGKIEGGATKQIVAKKKGTFPYFCRYHNGMTGTLTVR